MVMSRRKNCRMVLDEEEDEEEDAFIQEVETFTHFTYMHTHAVLHTIHVDSIH